MRQSILLRKIAGVFTACRRGYGMRIVPLSADGPALSTLGLALCLLLLPVLLVLGALVAFTDPQAAAGLLVATAPAVALPRKTRADLDRIIKEAEKIEKEHEGKKMPEDVATKLNELYKEGEELSTEINEEAKREATRQRMKRASEYLREVPEPKLPAERDDKSDDGAIVGYITPGDFAVLSDQYKQYAERAGWRGTQGVDIPIKGSLLPSKRSRVPTGQTGLISLDAAEMKALRTVYGEMETKARSERKDLPIFGDLVIAPQRVDRFVQDTRPDMLTLRDVLTVSPTSSNLIQYVAELSFTSGADIQSEGTTAATTALKGESDIEYELRDAPIRTIATTIPISEQQLSDAPALVTRINTRLIHAVRLKEEQLMGYGSGTGLEFAGFFDGTFGVAAATSVGGDTLIDAIRRAQTDVMTSWYNPDFVWIHPTDWEAIELEKGSDGHYIWAIIRDNLGARIWSMRVVQGVGTKEPGGTERNVLVGDSNGAVIYDRQQANIAIGWIDDQFARNLRTIRAEERMTLTIDAPAAFRKIETES